MINNALKKKVLIASNSSWNLLNFRYPIIKKLITDNYDVVICAVEDDSTKKLIKLGCHFVNINVDSNGKNPFRDFPLFFQFIYILFREKPDIFMSFTIKPNIYGGLAAHFFKVPVINTITGLGSSFLQDNLLRKLIFLMYKISLKKSSSVFFQNRDDLYFFVSNKLVKKDIGFLIPGSGVNINKYLYTPLASKNSFHFLFVGRLLRDKGIFEYLQAAKLIKSQFDDVKFSILGSYNGSNPNSISRQHIMKFIQDGVVTYCGATDDVFPYLRAAHCIVLPSYREGVPKVLLEAAAVGRPMIATDVPGCREVIDNRINGYLCRPKDAIDLANKMSVMLNNSLEKLNLMGQNARAKVENHFDENHVVEIYMREIELNLKDMFKDVF